MRKPRPSGWFTLSVCAFALLFSVAFVKSCLTEGAQSATEVSRHLESITLHENTIDWVVVDSNGKKYDYHIDLKTSEMSVGNEHRNFDKEEAVIVTRVSNWLARYCIESVQWWEAKDEKDEPDNENKDEASPTTKQTVSLR